VHFTSGLFFSGTVTFTVPVSITTLQARIYGDSPELLSFTLELESLKFELEEPPIFAPLELPAIILEEDFPDMDELDGRIEVIEDIKSGSFRLPSSLPVASSIFCPMSLSSSSIFIIFPLPQAIIIATVTDAAKISGIKLMNLNFFIITITSWKCRKNPHSLIINIHFFTKK
jgi:hypothetical protein